MMRLTGAGIGVLAGIVVSIALAFLLGFPELLGLAAGGLVLLAVAAFLVSGGGPIQASAAVPPRVERLGDASVPVVLHAHRAHRRGLRLRGADRADRHPVDWRDGIVTARVPIPTRRRGPLILGPWTLERVDPWGLLRRRVGEVDGGAVLVTPRVRPISLASLPAAIAEFGGSADMGTTTFAMLREYVIGDELRHVHWKSSAKVGTLMMRQYVDVTRPRLTLVLVVDDRAYRDEDEFEDAVDLAASLASVAGASGLDVELVTTAGERTVHKGARSAATFDLLSVVGLTTTSPDVRLLRAGRSTTVLVRGNGPSGWWDRIPSAGVVKP